MRFRDDEKPKREVPEYVIDLALVAAVLAAIWLVIAFT